MNNSIFLVDIGYSENTVVYELVPKKVAQLKGYSLQGIGEHLRSHGIKNILIDAGNREEADEFILQGFNVGKFVTPPKWDVK